jgi:hypothetical protein
MIKKTLLSGILCIFLAVRLDLHIVDPKALHLGPQMLLGEICYIWSMSDNYQITTASLAARDAREALRWTAPT